jgi:chemotaxis protein CheD
VTLAPLVAVPETSAAELRVAVGQLAVRAGEGVLATFGLGSCVALAMHDPVTRVAGLAHILLPVALPTASASPARVAGAAVPLLLARMVALGARPERVRAKLAGGACMFPSLLHGAGMQIGERNVAATRAALERARIPIAAEDVGGDFGRSVFLRVADGQLLVKSLRTGHVTL